MDAGSLSPGPAACPALTRFSQFRMGPRRLSETTSSLAYTNMVTLLNSERAEFGGSGTCMRPLQRVRNRMGSKEGEV